MFFNADQTEGALARTAKPQGPSQPSQHLNQQQFPKKSGPAEGVPDEAAGAEAGAGAAEGAAAGGAEAGAAGLAELAPLLLL